MTKTIFFDLFWTLIAPHPPATGETEYGLLGISKKEWWGFNEDHRVADERYRGLVMDEKEMLRRIITLGNLDCTEDTLDKIHELRLRRIHDAMVNIDPIVFDTLYRLKERGFRLCIISNADAIDIHWWNLCLLKNLVDDAVFSCDTGFIKPEKAIYDYALKRMDASREESLYVGDGGSDELNGARKDGMKTVLTEFLVKKDEPLRSSILKDADYVIGDFSALLKIAGS